LLGFEPRINQVRLPELASEGRARRPLGDPGTAESIRGAGWHWGYDGKKGFGRAVLEGVRGDAPPMTQDEPSKSMPFQAFAPVEASNRLRFQPSKSHSLRHPMV